MKAIEFSTKLFNNQILIPPAYDPLVKLNKDKDIRVIVLIEEPLENDEHTFKTFAKEQFFKGYAASDSIYDKD